jgi:hypothetical protein
MHAPTTKPVSGQIELIKRSVLSWQELKKKKKEDYFGKSLDKEKSKNSNHTNSC